MSLFIKPQLNIYPRLAAGREVAREKKPSTSLRKNKADLPDDMNRLKEAMEQAKNEKMENSYVRLGISFEELELICVCTVRKSSAPL